MGLAASRVCGQLVTVQTKQFAVQYQANASSVPLTGADLWYTQDRGRTWHRYGRDADGRSPIEFLAPREGRYGFFLVLHNRFGSSSGPPTRGTRPQQSVFVDFTPPVVQFHDARLHRASNGVRTLRVRWTAYDTQLPPRPVRLAYRLDGQPNFLPVVDPIANRGRFDWVLPLAVTGRAWIRLTIVDRGGHAVRLERGPVDLGQPPAKPTATQPAATQPADDAAPRAQTAPPARDAIARAAQSRYDLGAWHHRRGELDLAATRFREALRRDPQHTTARNDLAAILHERGASGQAAALYEAVLRQNPTDSTALQGQALAYLAMRDYRNAQQRLGTLVDLEPDNADAWLQLGDAALFGGDAAAARQHWSYVLKLASNDRDMRTRAAARLAAHRN